MGWGGGGSAPVPGTGECVWRSECAGQGCGMGVLWVSPPRNAWMWMGPCGGEHRRRGLAQTAGPRRGHAFAHLDCVRRDQTPGMSGQCLPCSWVCAGCVYVSPMSLTLDGQWGGVLDKVHAGGSGARGCSGPRSSFEGPTASMQFPHIVDFTVLGPFMGSTVPLRVARWGRLPEMSQAR